MTEDTTWLELRWYQILIHTYTITSSSLRLVKRTPDTNSYSHSVYYTLQTLVSWNDDICLNSLSHSHHETILTLLSLDDILFILTLSHSPNLISLRGHQTLNQTHAFTLFKLLWNDRISNIAMQCNALQCIAMPWYHLKVSKVLVKGVGSSAAC